MLGWNVLGCRGGQGALREGLAAILRLQAEFIWEADTVEVEWKELRLLRALLTAVKPSLSSAFQFLILSLLFLISNWTFTYVLCACSFAVGEKVSAGERFREVKRTATDLTRGCTLNFGPLQAFSPSPPSWLCACNSKENQLVSSGCVTQARQRTCSISAFKRWQTVRG